MKSVSLVAVAVSLIVAASVVLELVAGQDSYKLYLTKVYIKNACSKVNIISIEVGNIN